MARVTVDAGICGFRTVIRATSNDMQHVVLEMETSCPNLKPMTERPLEVDAFVECFARLGKSSVYEIAGSYAKHPGCPVASGMIKAIEVASGLALSKDAVIHVSNDDAPVTQG